MRLAPLLLLAASAFAAQKVDLMVEGAVDGELQPLLAALEGKKQIHIAAWTFWTGKIGAKSVVIARTEMGPINAAAATALGIERFHPAAVINQGTAGAHDPALSLWDIVVGVTTTDYSAFTTAKAPQGAGVDTKRYKPLAHRLRLDNQSLTAFPRFPGDARLAGAAAAIPYARGKVMKGNIGSAFQINREIDEIDYLRRSYGTDSEDMESAYAAGVAAGMKTPFLAIRIISDSEWKNQPFQAIAGEYCAAFVLDLIRFLK